MDVSKAINDSLSEPRVPKPRPPGWFHAGESGMCPRALFYKFKAPKAHEPKTLRKFRVGTMIHEEVQRILGQSKKQWVECERPVTVTDVETDMVVSGKADVFIIENNKRTVVELKSVNTIKFVRDKGEPNKHHVAQLTMYMRALRAEGYLVYVDKTNLETQTFKVPYVENYFKHLMDKFRKVYEHLTLNTLPDTDPIDSWECRWCQYKNECENGRII